MSPKGFSADKDPTPKLRFPHAQPMAVSRARGLSQPRRRPHAFGVLGGDARRVRGDDVVRAAVPVADPFARRALLAALGSSARVRGREPRGSLRTPRAGGAPAGAGGRGLDRLRRQGGGARGVPPRLRRRDDALPLREPAAAIVSRVSRAPRGGEGREEKRPDPGRARGRPARGAPRHARDRGGLRKLRAAGMARPLARAVADRIARAARRPGGGARAHGAQRHQAEPLRPPRAGREHEVLRRLGLLHPRALRARGGAARPHGRRDRRAGARRAGAGGPAPRAGAARVDPRGALVPLPPRRHDGHRAGLQRADGERVSSGKAGVMGKPETGNPEPESGSASRNPAAGATRTTPGAPRISFMVHVSGFVFRPVFLVVLTLLSAPLVAPPSFAQSAEEVEKQLAEQRKELDAVRARLQREQKALEALRGRKTATVSQLKKLEDNIR